MAPLQMWRKWIVGDNGLWHIEKRAMHLHLKMGRVFEEGGRKTLEDTPFTIVGDEKGKLYVEHENGEGERWW